MPVPTFSGLPPYPTFEDHSDKINKLTNELRNLLLNLDTLNIAELNADVINAGTINGQLVTIRSDLTTGYIQIDGTGMVVNNGSYNTFVVDLNGNVVMTSATVQSQNAYPKVVMDPTGDLFGAYASATSSIVVGAFSGVNSKPYLEWADGSDLVTSYLSSGVLDFKSTATDVRFNIGGDLDLIGDDNYLYPTNLNHVESWNRIYADSQTESLQDALDDKASSGVSTGSSGGHNHGIPDGTVLRKADGTTITFFAAANHSHSQT